MFRPTLLFAAALTVASLDALPAQPPAYARAYVLATSSTPTPTTVFEVDLATGAITALPTMPTDFLVPLAIERDPIDGSFLMAFRSGSDSLIVRRRYAPQAMEVVFGSVPGLAVDLLVDRSGDVIVATGGSTGGLYRQPRDGSSSSLLLPAPHLTAAGSPERLHSFAILGMSGASSPVRDAEVGQVELTNSTWTWGPNVLAGYQPRSITGLLDMPTGVPRQILAHGDGTMSVYTWAITGSPQPLTTLPALPAGGIVAMKAHEAFQGILLGGNANPYLYSFDPYSALSLTVPLTTLAGPFAGTPVDYTVEGAPGPEFLSFGEPCGTLAQPHIGTLTGPGPVLGNLGFGLQVWQGRPSAPAWLALGFHENFVPLPSGCSLRVGFDALAVVTTDASGAASVPIPIPNAPWLLGVRFFGQWLQVDGAMPFLTSDVAAVRIG